jgi:hypothetical protein
MVGEFVHLIEEEGVGGDGEHQDPPRLEYGSCPVQGPLIVIHVFEDVEHTYHWLAGPQRGKAALVDEQEGPVDPLPRNLQPFQIGIAGPRDGDPGLGEECQQATASAPDVKKRAASKVGDGSRQSIEDHLAPYHEPEMLLLYLG